MTTIYLEGRDIPSQLRGSYTGNKFKVEVCETVTIHSDAGLWSGGSRDTFSVIRLDDGKSVAASDNMSAPWDDARHDRTIQLHSGFAVVRSSMFRGKDMGLTFYIHPDNATKFLPVKTEVSELEKIVLTATRSLKSSYGGKDRYEMTVGYNRSMGRQVPSRSDWDAAKQTLIASGHLDKRGAITVKGKNAI